MHPRFYTEHLKNNLEKHSMMLFLMGARQVGKTTISRLLAKDHKDHVYINWDVEEDRLRILSGQRFIEDIFSPGRIGPKPLIIFDELHKYKDWKNFLKGFYDLYKDDYHIIVTGSALLNVFKKGGDSLMGRYIPYTIHPFSMGELNPNNLEQITKPPFKVSKEDREALYEFGGYPTPFLSREREAYNQWKRTRRSQLFREDIRDLTQLHEVAQLELCAHSLEYQSGNILNRSTISNKIRVSNQTISRWIEVLKQFYLVFTIYPWTKNIPHSLIKEPKVYFNDWSFIEDPGMKFENFIASHLKKAVDFWCESGKGEYELFFLRDKRQREVDFLITRENIPWILVEAKTSEQKITPALHYYKEMTGAPFAFQVTKNMEYVDYDCFSKEGTFIVPSSTFLSQLV